MKKTCYRTSVMVILSALLSVHAAFASEDSIVTSVFSNVGNGYTRTKMPDGSFKRETYAIASGGYSPGIARDESIDAIKFPTIAGVVAQHLARQNYYLAQDAKSAELLLVVSWGKTIPFADGPNRNAQEHLFDTMNLVRSSTPPPGDPGRGPDGIQSPAEAIHDAAVSAREGALFEMQMFNSMREQANERNARLLGYIRKSIPGMT